MAEAAIAKVTEEAVVGCINQIKHHFNYLSQYHDNMENLDIKLKNLESKRTEVQDEVFKATDKGETIRADVHKWLGEVAEKVEEAEKILNDREKVGNGCWKGWFVNLKPRYSLSKKAMKKSGDLDTFLAQGVFEIVAHPKRPLAHVFDSVGATSSQKMKNDIDHQIMEVEGNEDSKDQGTTTSNMHTAGADEGLTSRSVLLNDVMVAVKDPKIRIIRICGMGGIGKTTVAKQVEQKARAERLFHEIARVEVNQKPISVLQLHIAERFSLKLEEDDVPARAVRLCERLNAKDQNGQNKRILLILDNVWKKEVLEEAGIPLTDEKSLCKILLTSRSNLVCNDITPEPAFDIANLSYSESLILFRRSIPEESFYDEKMAEELVKECGGLPISITAIAGAVAGKEEVSWTVALRKLQKSEFTGEYAQVFNSLKVSYDFLENEEIKSFLRLFCFFRKGSDVPIEDLARYGMALGCFPNSDKLYEARSEAHSYADTLLHSNILLRCDKTWCFKVHDVVWDFAVSAPSNDLFIVNHGDALIKSPTTVSSKNYTSMSLQCSEMVDVPKGVDVRNLKFLQLIGNFDTLPLEFPNNFFEKMNELNVLAFRSLEVTPLPKSLQHLNNLLSLSFDRCDIGSDISVIGNLEKLEILSFAHSNIRELPIQIANLKELRLLDMTGCGVLYVIAQDVLSKLRSLEELYMRGTPLKLRWGSPTLFAEIASMPKLVVIDIAMPVEVLPMDVLFAKLKHFKISVTTSQRYVEAGYLLENYLDLECDSIVLQQRGVKLLLQETVRMDLKVSNLKSLFPLNDSEVVNFSKLRNLSIESCNEMVYLVNMMGHLDQTNVFQNLVSLRLYKLPRLIDVFHVRGSNETVVAPFCNLKVLNVESCDELENLFSSSDARSLNRLEVIKVIRCRKLKVVLGKGRHGEVKVELRNLKEMTLEDLPILVGFCSDVEAPEFPQLEELKIRYLSLITSIIHPEIGPFDSSHSDDSSSHPLFSYKGLDTSCKFQKLISLKVEECRSLRHLFTTSIAISFPELQHLEVKSCRDLTTIIAEECIKEEKEKNSATEVMLFPKLKVLYLEWLRLSTFLPKGYTLTCSSLKNLRLVKCGGEWNTLFLTPNKSNIRGGGTITNTTLTTTSNKFMLTSLEELDLMNVNIPSRFWYDYFPCGFSYQLRKFEVNKSEQSIIMFSPHMIREFQQLNGISVRSCISLEVMFDLEEERIVGSKLPSLNKLDSLYIKEVPKMVNIWKKVSQNFQGFGNLTELEVEDCDSLRYLFVPSIAKCLVKLRTMRIENCDMMEEVVSMRGEKGELTDDIILFPQLQALYLKNLPSLKYLEAPNVVEAHDDVNATSTSTSNIISSQESIDPILPALVRLQGIVCHWPWSFHKLKTLVVDGCNDLLSIFPPNRVVRLPALETLSVKDCKSLRYILSSSMAASLEQLMALSVEGCRMMTEVIRKDEEEEVDRRIKVVFHSLTVLQFNNLPNLEGICLGTLSFDWPLLGSLNIINCLKMRIFTCGYSTTPDLEVLYVNGKYYNPMGEGDVNTVLRNAQIKVANLALKEEGTLLNTLDFELAGHHLIAHYSTWSWESSIYDNNEKYLIARKVACLRRPRNTTTSQLVVEKQDQDQNEVEVDPAGDDEMNIYKPRTYDVSITYDHYYDCIRLWVKGYDESNMDLPLDLVFEDINMEYLEESHVIIEDHPRKYAEPHRSLFPSEKSHSIAKVLFRNLLERGFDPTVQNHLQLFVDELFPTFQFGPAP